MALFEPLRFENVFAPLAGRRIGHFMLDGNVGDYLLRRATHELFDYFDIRCKKVYPWNLEVVRRESELDELAISGGGNMGSDFYPVPFKERRIALETGLPVTILPQTFVGNDENLAAYKKIYVREKRSLSLDNRFELAPDLAMGLNRIPRQPEATAGVGMFLRGDAEARFPDHRTSLGDPACLSATPDEYLELAARFEHVVTDRLHFAIAGLLHGRKVTLLPNSYWKNRAVFDTWLRELDCQWLDDPGDITGDPQSLSVDVLRRLAGPPSTIIDWSCRPVRQADHKLCRHGGRPAICRLDGTIVVRCDEYVQLIWALCDGNQTTEEILSTLIELYPEDAVRIAQDLQETLRTLSTRQAIYMEAPVADEPGRLDRVVVPESSPKQMVVTVNPVEVTDGEIHLSATLDEGRRPVRSIWFRLDERCRSFVHPNADPFVLVILMRAMRQGRDIVVHNAPVSSGLLANLERYQQLWHRWREGLSRIEIRAEASPRADAGTGQGALLAFSGGVDSCFTTYEYSHQKFVRHQQPVMAGMMIYGFDIECSDRNNTVFERAARNSRRILKSVKLPLLTVRTNAKTLLSENWLDDHGVMLAAALHLFKGGFRAGVIPNTLPYELLMPLGSNPVTDPLLSSAGFEIIHHGGHASRLEKISAVGGWPAARRNLRVCWSGPEPDRNCGHCAKCVITHLGFWANGVDAPCFGIPLSAELVEEALGNLAIAPLDWFNLHCIVVKAQESGRRAPWLPLLQYKLSVPT